MKLRLTPIIFLFCATNSFAAPSCPTDILTMKTGEQAITSIKKLNPKGPEKMPQEKCEPKMDTYMSLKPGLCSLGNFSPLVAALGILEKENSPILLAYSFRFNPETHKQIETMLDKQYPRLKEEQYPERLKNPGHWEQTAVYKDGEHYLRLIHPIEGSRGLELTMLQFMHKNHLHTIMRDYNSCK